jgi:hypothetical protein
MQKSANVRYDNRMMRRASRAVLVATLLCALLALFMPARAVASPQVKTHCCAAMQHAADTTPACPLHPSPEKKQNEQTCCKACPLALALLFPASAEFVYASTGEEAFLAFNARNVFLPHRPPVPPPRLA